MKNLTLLLTIFIFLSACSDDYKKPRGEFLSGCISSGGAKEMCSCTFSKMANNYTAEEIIQLSNQFQPSESFMNFVFESAMECAK